MCRVGGGAEGEHLEASEAVTLVFAKCGCPPMESEHGTDWKSESPRFGRGQERMLLWQKCISRRN